MNILIACSSRLLNSTIWFVGSQSRVDQRLLELQSKQDQIIACDLISGKGYSYLLEGYSLIINFSNILLCATAKCSVMVVPVSRLVSNPSTKT